MYLFYVTVDTFQPLHWVATPRVRQKASRYSGGSRILEGVHFGENMATAKRKPIIGVWGFAPAESRGRAAGQGSEAKPPEA